MSNKTNKKITADVFLREKYHLTHNPFKTEACTDSKEYVERENEIHSFETDLDLVKISECTGKRIIGRKGIGKTSLVNMLLEVARKRGLKTVYVPNIPNSGRKFMQSLLSATVRATEETSSKECSKYIIVKAVEETSSKEYSKYIHNTNIYPESIFEKWAEIIDEMQPKPVIVALDETENLLKIPHIMPLFNTYIPTHANNVMFLLCCLPSTHEKLKDTAFIDRFPIVIRLRSFTNEELICLLRKRLSAARTKSVPDPCYPFTKKAVERLLDHAGGVPRYLLDIAFKAINMGVKSSAERINEQIINQAAIHAERGYIIGVWDSLNTSEKQTLIEIVDIGGEVKLDDITTRIKKDKSWVWDCVNELVERGLVEKMGEAKKDVTYKLITDPKLIMDLKNKEGKNT